MLAPVLARLIAALREESHALVSGMDYDISVHTQRKSQLLYELTLAFAELRRSGSAGDVAERLAELKEVIAENHRLLALHLEAARQVSSLIVTAMRQAETDGTYARGRPRLFCQ